MSALCSAALVLVALGALLAPPDHRVPFLLAAGLAYAAGGGVVAFHARRLSGTTFGLANMVTLTRLVIACTFTAHAAALMSGASRSHTFTTAIVALGLVALVLDGVDGWLARRLGTATPFGARFDMEVDAYFILVLSVIAWASGKAGAWVMTIGAARYVYVAAGAWWPALARPLFPSQRRKTIAVVQMSVLTLLLVPEIVAPLSAALAAGALMMLLYSFAADIRWQIGTALAPVPVTPE